MASRADGTARLRLIEGGASAPLVEPARATPPFDDSEILRAVRAGDASMMSHFYDRVRPQIDRTIVRLLGRHDPEHDDIAQIAAIELLRSLGRFRGDCSLDTWTSRVTAHAVFKDVRRRKSERRLLARSVEVPDAADPRSVVRAVHARNAIDRVRRHLDAIEYEKAWTVLLHDVCGYDLREVSEITDASVAAAQTRLVRGRRELHARIAQDAELAGILEESEAP